MLTPGEILGLLAKPVNGTQAGKVEYLAQREARPNPANGRPTQSQRAFLDAMRRVPVRLGTAAYRHPETNVQFRSSDDALTPAELAWLQRLPSDPAQVSYNDASALATLAKSVTGADARLVNSVWQPVKEYHDRNVARLQLESAAQPLPQIPSEALNALADAIQAHPQTSNLTPAEAIARACEMLGEVAAIRSSARDQQIADAQGKVAAVDDATARRTSPVPL